MANDIVKLDDKDRSILYQLDVDARKSNADIGKTLRISKDVVGYHIRQLINNEVIKGFYALPDVTKIGYKLGRVYIKFQNTNVEKEKEIIEFLVKEPKFFWVRSVSGGDIDLSCGIIFKDVNEINELKQKCLTMYREYISEYQSAIFDRIHIYTKDYLVKAGAGETQKWEITSNNEPTDFDSEDLKIIHYLTKDGRMPVVDIAKKTGLSVSSINYRMGKMKKNNLMLAFRPLINLAKIGYQTYRIEFQLEDYKRRNELLASFIGFPNIVYAFETIGTSTDVEIEIEVESAEKFEQVLNSLRDQFATVIRSYKYYKFTNIYKMVFTPPM